MKTVGTILKDAREKKGFTLQQVEKKTKIRIRFLKAMEDDKYHLLPEQAYVKGFLKNYSDFLGLKSTTTLAIFRRQYKSREKKKEIIEQPLATAGWQITPNKVIFSLIVIIIFGLMGYFYNQYRLLQQPPPLRVQEPIDGLITQSGVIAVFGETDTDATVIVNTIPVLVQEDGKFFKEIPITLGTNTITVEATSRQDHTTTIIRTITQTP